MQQDTTAESRKSDHITLAFQSQIAHNTIDTRFYYEPLFAAHPAVENADISVDFLGKKVATPMWVSSMTGGTAMARTINRNLAQACSEFGMGMGLGSCRQLLHSNEHLADFAVRELVGDAPFFANLGIAQLEELITNRQVYKIAELVKKLEADGLIIHINPLQEWLQPEGDRYRNTPLETIKTLLDAFQFPIIVKEVGQGMGIETLRTLYQLPLAAVDFAAAGGTNFAKIELLRSSKAYQSLYNAIAHIGHTADEMVGMSNALFTELGDKVLVKQVIISGGVRDFLDGYYLTEKINCSAVYGQASAFLKHAQGNYADLQAYIAAQIEGLHLAKALLKVKK
ncbi:MAG: hypothetical protein RI894_822 [Bacteroidota bacterium]